MIKKNFKLCLQWQNACRNQKIWKWFSHKMLLDKSQGHTILKDKLDVVSGKKKRKKKAPSLPLICASVCHALSNPGWNVSGRGVQRPWRTEQQVKLNSLRTCPASQLLQKFYCKVQPDPVLHKSPNVRVSYYFIFLSDTRICFSWEEKKLYIKN